LHVDQLAEVGERGLNGWAHVAKRCTLDGMLEEVTGKGRLRSEARVPSVARLIVARVKISVGDGSRDAAAAAGLGCLAHTSCICGREVVVGDERLEKVLDAAEAGLDLIDLSLTIIWSVVCNDGERQKREHLWVAGSESQSINISQEHLRCLIYPSCVIERGGAHTTGMISEPAA
jgi:hypothetical protein